ncbi:helix-turn-helix domain-containing protein [Emticicia sp. CRIBPO]|uniref:helix-turn-helix domain-containing protein n=1 Tax=Emticicia sp. CRIBPO TaxID=2683258 RepID=UPI001411CDA8|nr:AraC family transcriptional regulator [Emticicia sp. CRIBPO]NBA86507.1 helix-turn-helix domain-containing protein [Emticicia sp. CRIBPO]
MNNPLLIGLTTGGAFLLSFVLFSHPQKKNLLASKWLGIFVATLGCAMLEIFIHTVNLQEKYRFGLSSVEASRFLSAPALFLSVVFYTSAVKQFHYRYLWHFLPFLLFFSLNLCEPKLSPGPFTTFAFLVIKGSLPLQTVIYIILCFVRLKKHSQNLREIVSSTEYQDLSWLKNFLVVLVVVVLIWLNLAFFNFKPLYNFTPFIYLASVYFLAYFSLGQREVYAFNSAQLEEVEKIIHPKTTKQKRLSDDEILLLKNRLEKLMKETRIYLENDLTLPVLASEMNTSIHDLSFLINHAYNENFFSFINKYRIEEAKSLLLSEKFNHLNILGIAFQSGFNSKTTFNITFKKHTGLSPTDYVKSQR